MKYVEVKSLIKNELKKHPDGLTWQKLREQLKLPYKMLCPEWTAQLENEIGLNRAKGATKAFVWTLPKKS